MKAAGEVARCIICGATDLKLHFYPPNIFNGVQYDYYKCLSCASLSIFPFPDKKALDLIYGTSDHPYILDVKEGEKYVANLNREEYPKYTSHRYQLDFLEAAIPMLKGKKLLDYGCGGGFYVANAKKMGLEATGIEYNEAFASTLREKTGLHIFSLGEFERAHGDKKFDAIHFGHVLEHFSEPYKVVENIMKYSHPETLFIVDGPLENNACLSRWLISLGSRLKRRKANNYGPYHLSFTNYNSQLLFFKKLGLKPIKYEVREQYWPLPQQADWGLISSAARYLAARCSILASQMLKTHGNIFHYIGTTG